MSGRVVGGGGRERFRRDSDLRLDEKRNTREKGRNPPSRRLWVGNLSHNIIEDDLKDQFLQFGRLERIVYHPGRSYAFINFKNDHDAIDAMETLQGMPLAGNPMNIEFAKAEMSSTPSRTEDLHQDKHSHAIRKYPFSKNESRARHSSPDHLNSKKPRTGEEDSEPSEVLWVGFPALMKVDERILRKAFSPFGEIEKINVFPGRSYAFVRFLNIKSACKAKETLHGKLFGNPRVHVCFSRSEAGPSSGGRGSSTAPRSPHLRTNNQLSSVDGLHLDRKYRSTTGDLRTRPPHFSTNVGSGGAPDGYSTDRKNAFMSSDDNWRLGEMGSDFGPPQDMYELRPSPRERSSLLHDFPQRLHMKSPYYEEPWDAPEDAYSYHGAKKLKTGFFPPDNELPEFPFPDLNKEKHDFSRSYTGFHKHEAVDNFFEAKPFANKRTPDHPVGLPPPHGEMSEHWRGAYDNHVGSGYLPSSTIERKGFTPERDQPSLKVWKWEGIIAKGGTPICRARCFPVGKSMDILLPDFLDCTARTGLDMLAKHYYQASSAWVIFFAPVSDADIEFYNEFLHYLEEKQRAAVAKLDDKTTLFLVPPSDFSEKVLKVPGKLSIAGVVLRIEHPDPGFGSSNQLAEKKDTNLSTLRGDSLYGKHSGPFPSAAYVPDLGKGGVTDLSFSGNAAMSAPLPQFSGLRQAIRNGPDSYVESRQEYQPFQRLGPNWSEQNVQNSVSGTQNNSSQILNKAGDPINQGQQSNMHGLVQESSSSHYPGGISLSGSNRSSLPETKPSVSLSMPTGLQPEQLALLASSYHGVQRQAGRTSDQSMGENLMNQFDNPYHSAERYALENNQVTSEFSPSQYGQAQHLQQHQQQGLQQPQQHQQQGLQQQQQHLLHQQLQQQQQQQHQQGLQQQQQQLLHQQLQQMQQQQKIQQQQQPQHIQQQHQQIQQQNHHQQQIQQLEHTSLVPSTRAHIDQREFIPVAAENQQLQNTGNQEETDADPQKRLQATLQLAAALLHQIQQGKGT